MVCKDFKVTFQPFQANNYLYSYIYPITFKYKLAIVNTN